MIGALRCCRRCGAFVQHVHRLRPAATSCGAHERGALGMHESTSSFECAPRLIKCSGSAFSAIAATSESVEVGVEQFEHSIKHRSSSASESTMREMRDSRSAGRSRSNFSSDSNDSKRRHAPSSSISNTPEKFSHEGAAVIIVGESPL